MWKGGCRMRVTKAAVATAAGDFLLNRLSARYVWARRLRRFLPVALMVLAWLGSLRRPKTPTTTRTQG